MSNEDTIRKLIEDSGEQIGLAVHHIESGKEIMINADQYFPMASTFKIPVLVEACYQLAAGKINLEDRWELKDEMKNFPSGVLVFFDEGVKPTIKDLLTLMIIISDNTATDMLVNYFGKENIEARMRSLGFDHIHIPMNVRELFEEIMPDANPNKPIEEIYKMLSETGENEDPISEDNRVFKLTPENIVCFPREMTSLLKMIYEGKTPDRKWSDVAIDILLRQTINERLPRFLSPSTMFAHKTGTIGPVRNDAGIMYINDHSHLVVSMYVIWNMPEDQREQIKRTFEIETLMGEIGSSLYEMFNK